MGFSGGTYTRNNGTQTGATTWADAKAAGNKITTNQHDTHDQDIANALSTCVLKDGTQTMTQDIPFGGKKITGLGAGTLTADAVNVSQIQNGSFIYVATVGGTADVITLTLSPAIAAYVKGQRFSFIPTANNTGPCTININGLGALTVNDINTNRALIWARAFTSGYPVEIFVMSSSACYLLDHEMPNSGATINAAGTDQAGAAAIAHKRIYVQNVSAAAKGVRLPAAYANMRVAVQNIDTDTTLYVYPASGEYIRSLAVNVPLELAIDATAQPTSYAVFECIGAGIWQFVRAYI